MKKERTKGQKIWTIIEIIIGALLIATFITCIVIEGVIPDSDFTIWMRENVWDLNKTGAVLKTHVFFVEQHDRTSFSVEYVKTHCKDFVKERSEIESRFFESCSRRFSVSFYYKASVRFSQSRHCLDHLGRYHSEIHQAAVEIFFREFYALDPILAL